MVYFIKLKYITKGEIGLKGIKGETGARGIGLKGERGLKGVDGQKVSIFDSYTLYCFLSISLTTYILFLSLLKNREKKEYLVLQD